MVIREGYSHRSFPGVVAHRGGPAGALGLELGTLPLAFTLVVSGRSRLLLVGGGRAMLLRKGVHGLLTQLPVGTRACQVEDLATSVFLEVGPQQVFRAAIRDQFVGGGCEDSEEVGLFAGVRGLDQSLVLARRVHQPIRDVLGGGSHGVAQQIANRPLDHLLYGGGVPG